MVRLGQGFISTSETIRQREPHGAADRGVQMDSHSVSLLENAYRLRRTDLPKVLAEEKSDFMGQDPGSAAWQKERGLISDPCGKPVNYL
jgi:hypothetical protein